MEIDTTTLYDIVEARLFTQAYLGLKFKGNNDEFFHIVFEEWWYTENRRPLEEFLDEKRDKIKWWIKSNRKEPYRGWNSRLASMYKEGPKS